MTVTTVFASTGDASVRHSHGTYSTVHDAATASEVQAAGTLAYGEHLYTGSVYEIYVLFFPFDTSGIAAGQMVDSAVFSFAKGGDATNVNSDTLGIVQGQQATWNSLITADFDQRGDAVTGPTEGATRQSYPADSSTGYMDFTLNATGRGWIALNGETKPASASASGKTQLVVRFGRDMDNSAPTGNNYMLTYMADDGGAGTTNDPKLVVTHTTSSASSSVSSSVSASISLSPSSSVSSSISRSPSSSQSPSSSSSSSVSSSISSSISRSPSSSQSPSSSVSASISLSPSSSVSLSISPSPSSSISLSPSSSQSPSSSISPSPSSSVSLSISPSPSASPSVGYERYTRGDYAALPADDADLEVNYSAQDYLDVDANDGVRVNRAALGQYAIHQFKDFVGSANAVSLLWDGQSDVAPSVSPVVLQIYNRDSTTWENIDSDSASGANTDFELTAVITPLTDYKDASNVISCRVYQLSI